ncbi:cytochrome b/b6 domain-containing protein [Magnetovirga frankeli]|uniref:cytochrome b/b6 domain-containing protein n=1 Tax=Magnetovirga frankeli TaxID=947516 RepID=UPI001293EF3E|nr:cytochrome b/b6 domain-containing protein [gamma proteobacterium SS-5]
MTNKTHPQVRVWDLPVRLFHWSLAVSFVLAYLSGENDLDYLHSLIGYFIASLLLFRLLWGFIGSRHARFGDFVRPPSAVLGYLRQNLRGKGPRYLGHNPAGGAMVIALMLTLGLTALSGMALYGSTDFAGPMAGWFSGTLAADLLEETHEFLAQLSLIFIGLHLAGVLFSSLAHRENLIKSMLTGLKADLKKEQLHD